MACFRIKSGGPNPTRSRSGYSAALRRRAKLPQGPRRNRVDFRGGHKLENGVWPQEIVSTPSVVSRLAYGLVPGGFLHA